jgi:hypothetical protein
MSESAQIVTFYSYKGGVGRSMAVLNVAYALADQGLNVLVLDLDLEAPGLSGFLHRNHELSAPASFDIVDLLRWASQVAQSPEPVDQAALPPASDYIVSVPVEKFCKRPELGSMGRLDVIPVDEARDYYGRMTGLGIGNLDREALIRIGSVLRSWLKSRKFTASVPEYYGTADPTPNYDFILVDSRTGVTEIGGLCIGPLSDSLIVLTALNDQNINGTKQFLEEVGILATEGSAERLDPKPTLIVASPVPAGEIETKKARLEKLKEAVGNIVVKLSYHPQLALFETIFVRDYQDEYLAKEYFQLVELILKFGNEEDSPDVLMKLPTLTADLRREQIRRFLRNVSRSRSDLMAVFELLRKESDIESDLDYALLDQAYRYCSQTHSSGGNEWTLKRAELTWEWAAKTTDSELKLLRFEASQAAFTLVADSAKSTKNEKTRALNNWGNALFEQAKRKTGAEADRLFAAAIEKLLRSESLVPGKAAYNLACLTALKGQPDECRKWLSKSLEHGTLPSKQHLLNDSDLESVRSMAWFHELLSRVD